ncbi:MAG TPA: tRNA (adenosine(37)-N6)-threonylcarbamoyltransferase complex ATPase subunit type 1 TsaE [Pirellulales bacterium]|nr:tRNA (adenosine(37)-N6)-threonylcarbamoyltransferase complex ATPase subunit type 1 TsaE [Pirellulales bacterium]
MKSFLHETHDEQGTSRFGAALAASLPEQAVIALNGPLGAGKTRLVQGLAEALGVDRREVVSPTFVLVQEYYGRRPVFHFDAYRLHGDEEFWALGPEEYFNSPGVVVIEWAERVTGCLPAERLEIDVEVVGPTDRRFHCRAIGAAYEAALERLSQLPG